MPYDLELLDTPFVAVDLDVAERNIESLHRRAADYGLNVRPHTKTHKQPYFAQRQYEAGARSLTVAKLDEAAVMLDAGFSDLLIHYPLVGRTKAERLAALMGRGLKPTVAIDSVESMRTLARAAEIAESAVDVLVEVDTGFHRCGLTGSAVLELAESVHRTPGLRFAGLTSFAGNIAGNTDPTVIRRLIEDDDGQLGRYAATLRERGLPVTTVSVGGTILSRHLEVLRHATEVRPGIYVFNDMGIVQAGAADISACACRIWATVVSRPAPDRAVLDSGSKMLSTDGPIRGSYGHVVDHPTWTIARISEEHAVVTFQNEADGPAIGQRVAVVPNHVCTVMNLQDRVFGVRNHQVVATLPVLARGGTR